MQCRFCGTKLQTGWNNCPVCAKPTTLQDNPEIGPRPQRKITQRQSVIMIIAVFIIIPLVVVVGNGIFNTNSSPPSASSPGVYSSQAPNPVLRKIETISFYKNFAVLKKKILDLENMHDSAAINNAIADMNARYDKTYIIADQTITSFNVDDRRMVIVGQDPTNGPPDMAWEINDELAANMVLNLSFAPTVLPIVIEIPSSPGVQDIDTIKNAYISGRHRFAFRAAFKEFRNDSILRGPHAVFTFISLETSSPQITPGADTLSSGDTLTPSQNDPRFFTYKNSQLGYSINVPRDFSPAPPPHPPGGIALKSKDGTAFIAIESFVPTKTLRQLYDYQVQDIQGTEPYHYIGENSFVVSLKGRDGTMVFLKTLIKNHYMYRYSFTYPEKMRSYYAPLLLPMEQSLTVD